MNMAKLWCVCCLMPAVVQAADLAALVRQCAPGVHPHSMLALVRMESGGNPYAIGVVGSRLAQQPTSLAEALAAVARLEAEGKNFSMGLGQVNKANLSRYGQSYATIFDPCTNLQVASRILQECYQRAHAQFDHDNRAWRAAMSCYYSGNFKRGMVPDHAGTSYVERVESAAQHRRARGVVKHKAVQPWVTLHGEGAAVQDGDAVQVRRIPPQGGGVVQFVR